MFHHQFTQKAPASPRQRKLRRIVGMVMMLVSVLWFLGAGSAYEASREKEASWTRAEGTVIRLERKRSTGRKSGSTYYPVFRFNAADGQSYEVRSNYGSNPPSHKRGEKVSVLYPQDNPDDAIMDSFGALFLLPLFFAVFGTFFFGFGFIMSYSARKKAPLTEAD